MKIREIRVALVTGATFGVGRGVARALALDGARVFVTGRSVRDGAPIDERITGIQCDHRLDEEVTAAFERVARETHGIDILVNNVWGGYERMVEDGHSRGASRSGTSPSGAGTRCSAREVALTI